MDKRITMSIVILLALLVFIPPVSLRAQSMAGEYLLELGQEYYRAGRYQEALTEFDKALKLNPDDQRAKKYIRSIRQRISPAPMRRQPLKDRRSRDVFRAFPPQQHHQPGAADKQDEIRRLIIEQTLSHLQARAPQGPSVSKPTRGEASAAETRRKEQSIAETDVSPAGLTNNKKDGPRQTTPPVIYHAPDEKPEYPPSYYPEYTQQTEERKKVKISGEVRSALGINANNDLIWKQANSDYTGVPQEKNWRYLWGDKRHNTFDPKIYDSLKLDLEVAPSSSLTFFSQIAVDPWTFVGTKDASTTSTAGGDTVDITFKYWSGDNRTLNEIYRSDKGNIINIEQSKVVDGKTSPLTPAGISDWNTSFNSIGQTKVDMRYRPLRKLGLDYKDDFFKLRVFPISDQYEALTSDDPLRLSNNHVWWEESPWLDEYEPSRMFNPDDGTNPTKPGRWIRRLSFVARDSDYNRLTFLRGASLSLGEDNLKFTLAAPMSLWDNYDNANSVDFASRGKFSFGNLALGFTATTKLGLDKANLEARNYVLGIDSDWELMQGLHIIKEVAASYTRINEVISTADSSQSDNAYDGAAYTLRLRKDKEVTRGEKTERFSTLDLSFTHMEKDFFPGLSNYRYTRSDRFYSRHVSFAELDPKDAEIRLGDGVDRGRRVLSITLYDRLLGDRFEYLISNRYINSDTNKFVENASRLELSGRLNSKLKAKLLGWYLHLPKTRKNEDPLIYAKTSYALSDYFIDNEGFIENTSISEDKNADIGGGGLGLRYKINPQVSLEGIYEYTNDPGDFPRILLADSYVGTSQLKEGILYDNVIPFIYDQSFFDLPPYEYYSIVKSRILFAPTDKLDITLSFTRNSNRFAAGIDDNINHYGLEARYRPTEKTELWAKYIYSRLIDVYRMNKERDIFYEGHHNLFLASKYNIDDNQSLEFLFGEFVGYDDPYQDGKWSLSALDTQHLFRIFYRRKF
ncbi:MAG: tetratricopeptide repeat protein [Candidatus Omnitrophota bacterium]